MNARQDATVDRIIAAVVAVLLAITVYGVGYRHGETAAAPEVGATTCTLFEDGSVGCNASLVNAEDYHVGGACIVPEWGCGDE